MALIFTIQMRLLLVELPEWKNAYEDCNYKILCQKGAIDDPICDNYEYTFIPDNIPIDSLEINVTE